MDLKKKFSQQQQRWFFRLVRLSLAVSIAWGICQFEFHYFEALTYDLRYQAKPASKTSGYIQTLAVTSETVEQLGRDPNANDHRKLIEALGELNPRYIIYTLDLNGVVGSYDELEELANTANQTNFYLAVNDVAVKGLENELRLPPPLDKIKVVPGPQTIDKKIFAKDNVTRRFIYSFQGSKTIHPIIASQVNGLEDHQYKGLFDFLGSMQGYIDYRPAGTYKPIDFLAALKGNLKRTDVEGKIILIGRDTLTTAKDYIRTPLSREVNGMSSLEMHANIFDTLILNRTPYFLPAWVDLALSSLIAIITVFVVLRVRPTKGLVILLSCLAVFALLSLTVLTATQAVIGMAHPLVAIFICYYFFIPYRLIMENRKSWEYYHRNKLLTQVEELKSNFLRMMSHDLKTPLARIQGMAEIMLSQKENLNDSQTEAVNTIHSSTEELTDFIGSILNLGRIESKEIKLQLKSKDINHLLSEVAGKLEYLARKKNIEMITEFEPMFSIMVDEDLLKQVFTNLIENAIKYSPENTKVLITTEEVNGRIQVQVADQGIGISEIEKENVFSKFFRSRDVSNTNIKGSGLGLYLANYFVDLHKGSISVESEINKGSTFSVELPTDLEN